MHAGHADLEQERVREAKCVSDLLTCTQRRRRLKSSGRWFAGSSVPSSVVDRDARRQCTRLSPHSMFTHTSRRDAERRPSLLRRLASIKPTNHDTASRPVLTMPPLGRGSHASGPLAGPVPDLGPPLRQYAGRRRLIALTAHEPARWKRSASARASSFTRYRDPGLRAGRYARVVRTVARAVVPVARRCVVRLVVRNP